MSDFDPRNLLIQALHHAHDSHDRTLQVEIGPSSIGDCRRKVWHQIKGTPETNPDTEILAAMLGRFIHTGLDEVLLGEDNPFVKNFLTELEVEYNGLKGHVDLYVESEGLVCDFKTTSKKNLKNFPSQQNIYQIQVYAYLLKWGMGYDVKEVSLVVFPRDGRMDEVGLYRADYDELEALKGIAWLDELKDLVASGGRPPEPERSLAFCPRYCKYFDPSALIACPSNGRRF